MLIEIKRIKKLFPVLIIGFVLLVFAVIFFTIFMVGDEIKKGIKIEGVDVTGKNIQDAGSIITEVINKNYANTSMNFVYDGKKWSFGLYDISYEFHVDDALKTAYLVGREGDFFQKLYSSVSIFLSGKDIKVETDYDRNKLNEILKRIKSKIDTKTKDASISYTKGSIKINKDTVGKYMNIENNIALIEEKLKRRDFNDFNLIVESLPPKLSYEDIKELNGIISDFHTQFSLDDKNRGDNIRLACNRINSRILMPGEVFSMNETLGPRTLENGYKEAPIIFQNELVQGTGGGICQVTTTLYNTVLKAKLKVLERSHHSMPLAYVSPGQDATIAEDSIDFKFQNSNNYPICLNTEVIGGKIIMRLLGKSEITKKIVKLHSEIIETVPPGEDEIEIDDSLADGEKVVVRKARNGVRAVLYRDTYSVDNVLLDREKISEDYYKPVKGLIKVNSKYTEYIKTGVYQSE